MCAATLLFYFNTLSHSVVHIEGLKHAHTKHSHRYSSHTHQQREGFETKSTFKHNSRRKNKTDWRCSEQTIELRRLQEHTVKQTNNSDSITSKKMMMSSSTAAEVAACQAELLRQKIVFEEELRLQRESFQAQLTDANEKLKFREIDCRNLQAVVTILGRKLDALTTTVEDMQKQRQKEIAAQRYPNSTTTAAGGGGGGAAVPPPSSSRQHRAGSVTSHASAPSGGGGGGFSAFGRTVTDVRGGGGVRGVSPMRSAAGLQFSRTNSITSSVTTTAVEDAMAAADNNTTTPNTTNTNQSLPPPQHIEGKKASRASTPKHADATNAADSSKQQRGAAATRMAPIPTTILTAPTASSVAALQKTNTVGNAPLNVPNPNTAQNGATNAVLIPSASSAASTITIANSQQQSRPPSPRSLSFVTAYRPVGTIEGGVGLRGPTPTRVKRVTPERLRRAMSD